MLIINKMGLFDWISDKVSNVYNGIRETASNWLKGRYLAPGGYRYCGPGNPLENGEPINESDNLCRQHDRDYEAMKLLKDRSQLTNTLIRDSDNRLVQGLQSLKNRDLGSHLSEWGIRTKNKLEDWGLLDHSRFIT